MKAVPFCFQILTNLHSFYSRHSYFYCLWLLFIIFAAAPIVFDFLAPIWRVLCWFGPTILAPDVDAANHLCIYVAKTIIWAIAMLYTFLVLERTDGFTHPYQPFTLHHDNVIVIILFLASCITTLIGNYKSQTICHGRRTSKTFARLRSIDDGKKYADYKSGLLRTKLLPKYISTACLYPSHNQIQPQHLNSKQINDFVVRTCFITDFVISRTSKSANDKIYVYSLLTLYRTRLVLAAFLIGGIVHLLQREFDDNTKRDSFGAVLIWLTLPTIILPAFLRMKFGPTLHPMRLLKGFLPVTTDEQMWKRLGISSQDLYTALLNAPTAKYIVQAEFSYIGEPERKETGPVRVNNKKEARKNCLRALLGIENNWFIRVTDGEVFKLCRKRPVICSLSEKQEKTRAISNSNVEFTKCWTICEQENHKSFYKRLIQCFTYPFQQAPSTELVTVLRCLALSFSNKEIDIDKYHEIQRKLLSSSPEARKNLYDVVSSGGKVVTFLQQDGSRNNNSHVVPPQLLPRF